jgi:tetratricopeptide (TPR) repeat protein
MHPWHGSTLSTEPRSSGVNGQIAFDIGLNEANRQLEVKLAPTRSDIQDFVDSVADDPRSTDRTTTFELVHGRLSRAAADLTEIARAAREAADPSHFLSLLTNLSDSQHELVSRLGVHSWARASQIKVTYLPESTARLQVEWITDRLYGEASARAARDHLSVRFAAAAAKRETFDVRTLHDDLASAGVHSHFAPVADLTGLSTHIQDAIAILAALDVPVPLFVVSTVVGVDEHKLAADLDAFVAWGSVDGSRALLLTISIDGVSHSRRELLLAEALKELLDIAQDRSRRSLAITQIRNITRLAEDLAVSRPALVSSVYPLAEKLFKTTGNLQLALTTARLSLRASGRPPTRESVVSNQQLRDRAQTLICGESWVLQRVGELDEADRLASESLALGEHLGWDRNTAYCLKCRGRLLRMRAELLDGTERQHLLEESERSLLKAIDRFSDAAEFGPDDPEVGDCFSLLARTFLVAGKRSAAWRALLQGQNLLERERGQKDWADAQILEADLLVGDGDYPGAIRRLDEVLELFPASADSDATEIAARALVARARTREGRDPKRSGKDYEIAASLYERLEDYRRADEITWAKLVIMGAVPPDIKPFLEDEDVQVRVAAVAVLERELMESSNRAVGQRRGISQAHVRQLLADARLDADRRNLRWR